MGLNGLRPRCSTKMFYVYILKTDKDTLYTGQTNNLEARLRIHRNGKGSKYIRTFKYFELVYAEKALTLSLALKREREIKAWPRVKKLELVKRAVETLADSELSNQCFCRKYIQHKSKEAKISK